MIGTITTLRKRGGFGFIETEPGALWFFAAYHVERDAAIFDDLIVGDEVEFSPAPDSTPGRLRAFRVRRLEASAA